MMDCQADMDPMFLLTLIEPQLRACKHMSTYFIAYDLAESGSSTKTLEFLWNAARKECERLSLQATADTLLHLAKNAII